MNVRMIAVSLLVALGLVQIQAQSPPAQDEWFRASARPKDFGAMKLPWNTFTIEIPKDWQVVPGYRGTLLSVVEKTRNNQATAAIVVEQSRLDPPLGRDDIDATLAELETGAERGRDPAGEDFVGQVKEVDGRRFIFIRYVRPGLYGQDGVVQYVFPVGRVQYRLTCVAPANQLSAKYQATFAHVAASFKPSVQTSN